MATRIEGEYPPETSVPSPTWTATLPYQLLVRAVRGRGTTYFDAAVKIPPDRSHPAVQIEVASGAVADASLPLGDQCNLLVTEMHCMGQDGIGPEKPK
jgi:hypothetical protein